MVERIAVQQGGNSSKVRVRAARIRDASKHRCILHASGKITIVS